MMLHYEEKNMKASIYLILLICCLLVLTSCTPPASTRITSTSPENAVVVEGTVKYIEAWGTAEISMPFGYYLYNPTWAGNSAFIKGTPFLEYRNDLREYLNKRVYVEGLLQTVPEKIFSPIHSEAGYHYIAVDSISVIE
ncbi:MAG TPA: hypothetical protein VMU30_02215 [Bacteroidota bacterium]|nr:hypothetical protein [Bacteroidota bacterium]